MSTKTCYQCNTEKPVEDFYAHHTNADGLNGRCKPCHKGAMKQKRTDNTNWIRAVKMEKGCVDCGYKEHPSALDFDHLDEAEKSFNIGASGGLSKKRLKAEIEKCEVVCANCHRVRTYNRRHGISDGDSLRYREQRAQSNTNLVRSSTGAGR